MSSGGDVLARFRFESTVIYWRGPAPFFFAPIPPHHAAELRGISKLVTYGWGMAPVEATIGDVVFQTSLFPKNGTYLLPLKTNVRRESQITAGDLIAVEVTIRFRRQ